MKTKVSKILSRIAIMCCVMVMLLGTVAVSAADDGFGGSTKVSIDESSMKADTLMGNVIGIILTITRWVGVAILIFGVYEIVMSFTQDMPEKKVKGITLALAGVVMVALKSLISLLGITIS